MENCCDQSRSLESEKKEFEKILLQKTQKICSLCEDYAENHSEKEFAILSCEGACLRGEISRRVANIICHELAPLKTVRICLGSAFTKDTGQRNLVRNAQYVFALEGCMIDCASRTMKAVLPDIKPVIIHTDKYANFNKELFGINEMTPEDIRIVSNDVAQKIYAENIKLR